MGSVMVGSGVSPPSPSLPEVTLLTHSASPEDTHLVFHQAGPGESEVKFISFKVNPLYLCPFEVLWAKFAKFCLAAKVLSLPLFSEPLLPSR